MSRDSDLYGDDIRLWSELLCTLAPGEAVTGQAVWPHVVEEIEEAGRTRDEIARLTALLVADEALVKELRARRDDLNSKLGDTQTKLAAAQDQVEAATVRAAAAVEAEQAIRQADAERRARGRWARLRAAWRRE